MQKIFRLFRLDKATGCKYRDKLDEPLPDLSLHRADRVLRFPQVFEDERTPSVPLLRYSAPAVVPFSHVQEKRGIEGGCGKMPCCSDIVLPQSRGIKVLVLRFAQIFKDERGLASGEVVLHLVVACLLQVGV